MNIFKIYTVLFASKNIFRLSIFAFIVILISGSFFLKKIDIEVQKGILSVMSILFPLIAGFLTFGKNTLKELQDKIDEIIEKDNIDIDIPTSDTDKREIAYLKQLSNNFISVIISTFITSFLIIIFIIVNQLIGFEFISFEPTVNTFSQFLSYIKFDWFIILLRGLFVFPLLLVLFNLIYLIVYISKVSTSKHTF